MDQRVQSQFLCCFPVKKITWNETLNDLSWNEQKRFIDETVNLPELKKYPLQTKYVIRFLRHVIDELERQNLDIHDDFYTILCEYQLKIGERDNYSFKHYRFQVDDDGRSSHVILKENDNKISQGTTGLNVWESALALNEWSLINRSSLNGKCILELGAGTGLSSLVIGKYCAAKSIAVTDGNDKVIEILNENFSNNFESEANGGYVCNESGTKIDVCNLDWTLNTKELIEQRFINMELVIAADIIYDNSLFDSLLTTVSTIFKHCKKCEKMILMNAVRNPDTEKEFLNMLSDFGLEHSEEAAPSPKYFHWEENDILPIKLYTIRAIKR